MRPFVLFLFLFFYSLISVAAVDGTEGSSSEGQINADVTVLDLVKISGVTDISLGSFTGQSDLQNEALLCVYSSSQNLPQRSYTVIAESQSGDSQFLMQNGLNTVPYTVEWSDGTGFIFLVEGLQYPGTFQGADQNDCGGGSNATLRVTANSSDLFAVPAGNYADTLIITISPA